MTSVSTDSDEYVGLNTDIELALHAHPTTLAYRPAPSYLSKCFQGGQDQLVGPSGAPDTELDIDTARIPPDYDKIV